MQRGNFCRLVGLVVYVGPGHFPRITSLAPFVIVHCLENPAGSEREGGYKISRLVIEGYPSGKNLVREEYPSVSSESVRFSSL